MKFRFLLSNIISGFVPNQNARKKLRTKLRYNTRPFIKYVCSTVGCSTRKIKTAVGYGCRNFVVIADNKYVFKFPLRDNGHDKAVREKRIVDALRPFSTVKIPELELIEWNGLTVRRYEFVSGVMLGDLPVSVVNANRGTLTAQIAEFMYAIGRANPRAIADLKPSRTARPDFMYGWFHNDIGQNFMIDPATMNITAFIDWEGAAFTDFRGALYLAEHHWDKLGCRGFGVELMAAYSRLWFSEK